METTIREVADWVGGELLGDGAVTVREARTLNEAGPNDLTFVDGEKNLGAWKESSAAAAIVPLTVPPNGKPIIRVRDPLFAFATVVTRMRRLNLDFCPTGIHPSAVIDPTATIGPEPSIGPNVVIGRGAVIGARCRLLAGAAIGNETRLGDDVILHPHVVIYDRCTLGHRVIVHANSVIGADGFGYRTQQGQHVKTPQLGGVHLADDVEIGACTTIDRGTFSDTRIGSGTKIDNLVQIGHNCKIGSGNLIVSQVGIAGSCSTGDYVVLAGQVGIGDHCHLGDQVVVGAKSGIHSDIPAKSRVLGVPALPDRETMKIYMTLEKLPGMRRDLEKIKKQLDAGAKE